MFISYGSKGSFVFICSDDELGVDVPEKFAALFQDTIKNGCVILIFGD